MGKPCRFRAWIELNGSLYSVKFPSSMYGGVEVDMMASDFLIWVPQFPMDVEFLVVGEGDRWKGGEWRV